MKRLTPSLLVTKPMLVAVAACAIAPAATSGQAALSGPAFTIGNATVSETNTTGGVLSFPISVTNMSGPVTLVATSKPGTATPSVDYLPKTAVFSLISLGGVNNNYRFDVPIVGDLVPEAAETVLVSARILGPGEPIPLSGTPGVAGVPDLAAEPVVATGTIVDNDLVSSGTGATPPPPPAPAPVSGVSAAPPTPLSTVATLPPTKRCLSRRSFTIRIKALKDTTVVNALVRFRGKTHETGAGKTVAAPVDLRGLPKGRFTVKVTVVLSDGQTISGTRKYRTCTPKRA